MQEQYRRCLGCLKDLPVHDFGARKSSCRPCEVIRQKPYNARRYARAYMRLDQEKAKPCMDCGGRFPPAAMHFDHRDPATKRRGVSVWASSGQIENMLREIALCDLRCANCHAVRTQAQHDAGVFKINGVHASKKKGGQARKWPVRRKTKRLNTPSIAEILAPFDPSKIEDRTERTLMALLVSAHQKLAEAYSTINDLNHKRDRVKKRANRVAGTQLSQLSLIPSSIAYGLETLYPMG